MAQSVERFAHERLSGSAGPPLLFDCGGGLLKNLPARSTRQDTNPGLGVAQTCPNYLPKTFFFHQQGLSFKPQELVAVPRPIWNRSASRLGMPWLSAILCYIVFI